MILLLVNYALFGDYTLKIIGYGIAALELIITGVKGIKTFFGTSSKQIEKICERVIAKLESAKGTLTNYSEKIIDKQAEKVLPDVAESTSVKPATVVLGNAETPLQRQRRLAKNDNLSDKQIPS